MYLNASITYSDTMVGSPSSSASRSVHPWSLARGRLVLGSTTVTSLLSAS